MFCGTQLHEAEGHVGAEEHVAVSASADEGVPTPVPSRTGGEDDYSAGKNPVDKVS